jgi:exonuclease III
MDMRCGMWNVRSLYRAGSLKIVARVLGKYKLDLVGVQEVRWEKGGTERAEDYTFFCGEGNEDHQLGTVFFFIHKRINLYFGILGWLYSNNSFTISTTNKQIT